MASSRLFFASNLTATTPARWREHSIPHSKNPKKTSLIKSSGTCT